jgi:hypothetical protein
MTVQTGCHQPKGWLPKKVDKRLTISQNNINGSDSRGPEKGFASRGGEFDRRPFGGVPLEIFGAFFFLVLRSCPRKGWGGPLGGQGRQIKVRSEMVFLVAAFVLLFVVGVSNGRL